MESHRCAWVFPVIVALIFLLQGQTNLTCAQNIGMCYGLNGNNLPSPKKVIRLCQKNNIRNIRLFEPVHEVLEALRGSRIWVSLGTRNENITSMAQSQAAANAWVKAHVVPYKKDVLIKYITVGNEVIPGPYAHDVAKAIDHITIALAKAGVGKIKVTTVVSLQVLGSSYPPSSGVFTEEAVGPMTDVLNVLHRNKRTPIMANVYPYFSYASEPEHISSDYALFRSKKPVVVDNGLRYFNLFDAMVDSFISALEKIHFGDASVVISESGWPSAGNSPYASKKNALAYNSNLRRHVSKSGTPKRPNVRLDTYFFALFNENLKEPGVEQNFGLFYPDMKPVYPFTF